MFYDWDCFTLAWADWEGLLGEGFGTFHITRFAMTCAHATDNAHAQEWLAPRSHLMYNTFRRRWRPEPSTRCEIPCRT